MAGPLLLVAQGALAVNCVTCRAGNSGRRGRPPPASRRQRPTGQPPLSAERRVQNDGLLPLLQRSQDGSLGSMDAVAVATPGCAAHHHSGAVSSYNASCEAAPACTHEAGGRCPMCDLTTKDPARDADWTQLVGTLFRASPHDSAIFALALPAVLALAADPLLSMVDTIFVGQVGADALAALGVNSALFTFSFVVFNFLATATTPMVAAALAVGDSDRAGKVTLQALGLAIVLGGILTVALVTGSDGALALMGAGPETGRVHELATEFLVIRAAAAPAALLMTVGQGAFRGLQDMRTPLGITLAANFINLGLDVWLIMGLGWGVRGAATATTVAEWVAAAAYMGGLWARRDALGGLHPRLVLGSRVGDALDEMLPFLQAGGAMLMRTGLLLGTKTLASATAARLGVVPVAAHQVVTQLWLLSSLIVDSVAIAGQSLVAVQLGKGDVREARAVSNRLLGLGIGAGAALAAAFWLAEPVIPSIFSNDADVEAAVRQVLPIAVAMLPINAAVYVFDGIITGASDFKFMAGAMVLAAGTAAGLLLGVEPLGLGLPGVWYAMGLLMVSRLGTMMWRYQSESGPLPPSAERGELAESVAAPPPLAAPSPGSLSSSDSVDGGPGSRAAALNNAVEGPPLQQQGARRRGAAGKRGSPQ
ncbi:hypothetical protein ABPG77_007776 [Micractinium sp. CCAP 211/92]